MYNTVPIVTNIILCTSEFAKRADFMSSVLITIRQTNQKKPTKGQRKLREVLDMSITLTEVMLPRVFTYVQNHQIVHIKYV